jgi:hypothetical protein
MAGLVLLSAVGLTACGASGSPSAHGSAAALTRIRQSVARTEAAGTAHLAGGSSVSSTGHRGPTQQILVEGDIRFAGPDLSVTTTIRNTPSSSVVRRTSTGQSIYLGRHVYLGWSGPPATWTEVPFHAPYAYLGVVPTRTLETTTGPVTVGGSQIVDGATATEYSVPVPASVQAIRESDARNRPYEAHVHYAPFTLTVWLDGAGRIVRTSGTVVSSMAGTPGTVHQSTTTTLSAFGEPVHIVAPAVVVHHG